MQKRLHIIRNPSLWESLDATNFQSKAAISVVVSCAPSTLLVPLLFFYFLFFLHLPADWSKFSTAVPSRDQHTSNMTDFVPKMGLTAALKRVKTRFREKVGSETRPMRVCVCYYACSYRRISMSPPFPSLPLPDAFVRARSKKLTRRVCFFLENGEICARPKKSRRCYSRPWKKRRYLRAISRRPPCHFCFWKNEIVAPTFCTATMPIAKR